MYHLSKIQHALNIYDTLGSVRKTIEKLAYPSVGSLRNWLRLREQGKLPNLRQGQRKLQQGQKKFRHFSKEEQYKACVRCFINGESVQYVAEELGVSRQILYVWKSKHKEKGWVKKMTNPKSPKRKKRKTPENPEYKSLKEQIEDMQMEIDILRETINVIKKDPGFDPSQLKNSERVTIVDALKGKYPLPKLLKKVELARSSYYFHGSIKGREDKYTQERSKIRQLFEKNRKRYGVRRLRKELLKEGIKLSKGVIRRLMLEEGLIAKGQTQKRYYSYKGEITPAVPNLINRDFQAASPNEKWLTDITEFSIPAGKVYLSPIIDCYDGAVIARTMGISPNADLVNKSLEIAIATLHGENTIVHSDRGCHYRWPGWIALMSKHGLQRSMSRKGCSPDNSACEGFFGRLKNECFYGEDFSSYTIQEFIDYIDEYIDWYNEERIKMSLGGISPFEYRRQNAYAA